MTNEPRPILQVVEPLQYVSSDALPDPVPVRWRYRPAIAADALAFLGVTRDHLDEALYSLSDLAVWDQLPPEMRSASAALSAVLDRLDEEIAP